MSRNIKEIGKELLGKSLNSFHRKTGLTQLEKNNEMQDGILNGILSQVDDAYIEKTEQSNVIHLEGSGDGVVVVDSIEGNTMVNLASNYFNSYIYTRNNDKSINITIHDTTLHEHPSLNKLDNLKRNTTYTLFTSIPLRYIIRDNPVSVGSYKNLFDGISNKAIFTTGSDTNLYTYIKLLHPTDENSYPINNVKVMLLEGDWTNKEIPYFEGLQSSFEEKVNDEGKYEIEILSRYHYIDYDSYNNSGHHVKPIWTLSVKSISGYLQYFNEVSGYEACENLFDYYYVSNNTTIWINLGSFDPYEAFEILNIRIAEGEGKSNKIKLLLKSPLLKGDKLVVKDNELYHYHKWNRLTVDENAKIKEVFYGDTIEGYKKWMVTCKCLTEHPLDATYNNNNNFISNYKENKVGWHIKDTLFIESDKICCVLPNNISETEVKNYIKNNMMAIYRLSQPYYEEVLNEYGEPIILEGYENGTIYIDSTIVPTTTVRYTPKMESFKTLKEVENNNIMLTNDVNDNIIPYMMDVDLMIMEKEMALMSQYKIRRIGAKDMTSMQKRTQDMLTRLIKGKTLTEQECKTRVVTYLDAGKITDAQADELMLLISEVYA